MQNSAQRTGIVLIGLILTVLLSACSGQKVRDNDQDYGDYQDESDATPGFNTQALEPAVQTPKKPSVRIALRDDVPGQYIVKKGDTLWDIASLFLQDPWLWPEIWYFNPQIPNPHLIYPGDILVLVYVDGKPQLRLSQGGSAGRIIESAPGGIKTVKLSPSIRTEDLSKAIPTIPITAIEPFLVQPRVITAEELDAAPYILSSLDNHLVTATTNTVYARGLVDQSDVRYTIFRPGRTFKDPDTGEVLGIETTAVSEADLARSGDPATLVLTRSIKETLNGDRILPAEQGRISYNFVPRPPQSEVEGQIIALIGAISNTAKLQVVVINLGKRQGMEAGTVLAIDRKGSIARDNYTKRGSRLIKLPDERAGLLMVFRPFERVSYGLIVNSIRPVQAFDMVRNPASAINIISK